MRRSLSQRQNARRRVSVVLVSPDLGSLPHKQWGKICRPGAKTGKRCTRCKSAQAWQRGTLSLCRPIGRSRMIRQGSVPQAHRFHRPCSARKRDQLSRDFLKSPLRSVGHLQAPGCSASSSMLFGYLLPDCASVGAHGTLTDTRRSLTPGIANRRSPSATCLLLAADVSGCGFRPSRSSGIRVPGRPFLH